MNILLLTPQPPFPSRQGTAIRNWAILRHLAARHAVTLLSFSPEPAAAPAELASACSAVYLIPAPVRPVATRLRTAAAGQADLAGRLWSFEFERTLRRLIATTSPDLIQVEGLELGRYLGLARQIRPDIPIIYDAHNAEVTIQQRSWENDRGSPGRWLAAAYSWLQIGRLARFEAGVCQQADAVACVSEVDSAALQELVPGLRPFVVPNGIELAEYPPSADGARAGTTLLFTGKMDYRPNVDAALWFARDILPLVRQKLPAAQFEVVGQRPVASLLRKNGLGGMVVTGAVPDVRPFIARCAVYVAPLRMGGGTRFKLLEAMALARPVVSSTIGAEGFAVRDEQELCIADTADSFARAVVRLLGDPALARRLGQAGRAFVEAGYDWAAILPRLDEVYQQVVAGKAGQGR